ncbi:MAG: RES family NAD+ phosphorylase [Planctomycetota bacterium]
MTAGETLTAHPQYDRISDAFDRFRRDGRFAPCTRTVFRCTHPKYARLPDFINGRGAMLNGGRWTSPSGEPTVYASTNPLVALAETLAQRERFGIPPTRFRTRVIRGINVELSCIVDLSNGSIRQSLRVSLARMTQCDWWTENRAGREAITQAIGRAAADAGVEGLLVPTAQSRRDANLAVFIERLRPGSRLEITDPTSAP